MKSQSLARKISSSIISISFCDLDSRSSFQTSTFDTQCPWISLITSLIAGRFREAPEKPASIWILWIWKPWLRSIGGGGSPVQLQNSLPEPVLLLIHGYRCRPIRLPDRSSCYFWFQNAFLLKKSIKNKPLWTHGKCDILNIAKVNKQSHPTREAEVRLVLVAPGEFFI